MLAPSATILKCARDAYQAFFLTLGRSLRLESMPKRKEPELAPAEQFKRFREAAKEANVTKGEREFERAFKRVALDRKGRKKK